ncbi:hypothetical protein [Dyadobacter sp. OTU695]|uniref:hypothetical protein n=1 Tax=Dyadobacter sp. OTU695 TaxID=3043860 RepID=UPI00313BF9FA
MKTINYRVVLDGVGVLHSPKIHLENIQINLVSNNLKRWECEEVAIPVDGELNVRLGCFAISGTKWTFRITNKDQGTKVLDESGQTGSNVNKPNESDENFSIDPE